MATSLLRRSTVTSRQFQHTQDGRNVERWVPSTCGLCSVGCRLEIAVAGNDIVGVRGDPAAVVNRGRLGPKGLHQYYANQHSSRALYPMLRRDDGSHARVSWDEALDVVVRRLEETVATDGPDAIGIYGSGQLLLEEYYTIGKIARAGLCTAAIDANTRLCTATTGYSLIESFGADGPPGCYADFDETDCIVLIGHNAAEQSTVLWMRMLEAKAGPRQPKIIVVDPRRTLTARTGADLHLRLKPGTNVAVLNGLCHLLIENGWIDQPFIERHTKGFDQFRDTMARYTPDVVQQISGVPAADLRTAAEWIGTSERTVSTCLQGVYQSNQATAAACTVNSMHLLMGKIGRPGSAPLNFPASNAAFASSNVRTRQCSFVGISLAIPQHDSGEHSGELLT